MTENTSQIPVRPGGVAIEIEEVKGWIGSLYIELQLAQKQLRDYRQQATDYQQALTIAREELRQLREETEDGEVPELQ